jgi:hypothetical protein
MPPICIKNGIGHWPHHFCNCHPALWIGIFLVYSDLKILHLMEIRFFKFIQQCQFTLFYLSRQRSSSHCLCLLYKQTLLPAPTICTCCTIKCWFQFSRSVRLNKQTLVPATIISTFCTNKPALLHKQTLAPAPTVCTCCTNKP